MNAIAGGLIYVATLLTTASFVEGLFPFIPSENRSIRTDFGWIPQQTRPEKQAVDTTAVTLEVVSSKNCYWCKKFKKETLPTLVTMGYDVVLANRLSDTRGTTMFPTLYYLDAKGNVVLKQVGFQTAEEVIKHLGKNNAETPSWIRNPLRRYRP